MSTFISFGDQKTFEWNSIKYRHLTCKFCPFAKRTKYVLERYESRALDIRVIYDIIN